MTSRTVAPIVLLSAVAALAGPAAAQFPPAVYTAAQATRGKALYDSSCQSCHGPEAAGGQFGPALKGAAFQAKWASQPASALLAYIQANMPPGAARSMPAASYAAVTAYLLQANGASPGSAELSSSQAAAAPAPAAAAAARQEGGPPPPESRGGFGRAPRNEDAIYRRETARQQALLGRMRPVTDAMLSTPPEADWLMWRRAYDGLGYSPLKQINTGNVSRLQAAWSWSLHLSNNEITPVVHDGVLFVHSGDAIQALDATNGELLWQYIHPLPDNLNAGRGARSKGIAIYQNTIYAPMVDGHMIAIDARTGKLLWDHLIISPADIARGVRLNGVPIVAKGKVMMGISLSLSVKGGCYIVALDAQTGEEKWRFNTVAQPGEVGGDTWNGLPAQERFGAALWTGGSYDPELNLVYFGTGNTYNTQSLIQDPKVPGHTNEGLFTESTVAINPDTGKLAWHFQHMPRDLWDMDWTFEQSLIDMPVNGVMRKLVVTGGKMALFDAVDRATGAFVFSRDAGLQNIVTAVDPKTGAKTYNPAVTPVAGERKHICPSASAFRNWQATAYNPQTHILYVPMFEQCADYTWTPRDAAAVANGGIDQAFAAKQIPGSDGNFGRIQAINLRTGATAWVQRQRTPMSSSMLATAGGIAFSGSGDRYFRALDQASGKILWRMRLSSTASATPITYSVDGVQYVAVVAGGGNPQDTGWASLAPEITNSTAGTTLWVFKLP